MAGAPAVKPTRRYGGRVHGGGTVRHRGRLAFQPARWGVLGLLLLLAGPGLTAAALSGTTSPPGVDLATLTARGAWSVTGPGGERATVLAVVASGGEVLAADGHDDRIATWHDAAAPGNPLVYWALPGGARPSGLAFAPTGGLWVAEAGRDRVVHLEPGGQADAELGRPASGPVQLRAPVAVAADPTEVVVADEGNQRIVAFAPDGRFVRQWGGYGAGPGQFNGPAGVALLSDGRVVVADSGNGRVEVFDRQGVFAAQWEPADGQRGHLVSPYGVSADAGRVYVADPGAGDVVVFDSAGAVVSVLDGHGAPGGPLVAPYDVAVDGAFVLIGDGPSGRVVQLGPPPPPPVPLSRVAGRVPRSGLGWPAWVAALAVLAVPVAACTTARRRSQAKSRRSA